MTDESAARAGGGGRVVGLDHVQIAIPEGGEDAGRAFYGEILGLREVPKPPALAGRGGCWFAGEGIHVHLGVERDFRPARKAHVALLAQDLAELRSALSAAGVAIVEDDAVIGVERFYASDPFGNRIELVARRDRGFTERTPAG